MNTEDDLLLQDTRRHFFNRCGIGLGKIALASLMAGGKLGAAVGDKPLNPMAAKPPHFPAKVKNVIFCFMAGAPSQLDMFSYKPKLKQFDGTVAPEELMKGKRFAFMDTFAKNPPRLLGSSREFKQYGKSGFWFSSLLPNIAGVADD
ncbi:MAG TPA: DUF1501 domain-containing protein, partial [Bryobacteraceae bacterium]|nr:DUF1501 domain-containing protein [Bryobacteraceae bacterium]